MNSFSNAGMPPSQSGKTGFRLDRASAISAKHHCEASAAGLPRKMTPSAIRSWL